MNSVPESDLGSVLMSFSRAIRLMVKPKVPPPEVFRGTNYHTVEDFFQFFEHFALSVYGDHKLSWLQILPAYLEGEPKNIVKSFGIGSSLDYTAVKETVIEVCNFRALDRNYLVDFMELEREACESPVCFSIRLRMASKLIPGFNSSSRKQLVVSKFLASVSDKVREQLNTQLGHREEGSVGLAVILKLTTILEKKYASNSGDCVNTSQIPPPINCYVPPVFSNGTTPAVASCRIAKSTGGNKKCWKCGVKGHFKSQCWKVGTSFTKPNCRIKMKRCFICKCKDHLVNSCPWRRNGERIVSNETTENSHSMTALNIGVGRVPNNIVKSDKNILEKLDQGLVNSMEFWEMESLDNHVGSGDCFTFPDAVASGEIFEISDNLEHNFSLRSSPTLQSFCDLSSIELPDPFGTWPSTDLFSLCI